MRGIILIACCIIFLFNACVQEEAKLRVKQPSFFDLEQYFETEINRLTTTDISIKKSIHHKGATEQKKFSTINWKTELALFIKGDINKPSWLEKYTVDSTFNAAKELTQLLYKTDDEEMYTQVLDIKFKQNQVHSIIIVNNINNAVYASQQYLKYIPTIGYSIDKTQDVTLFDKKDYKVEVEFVQP